MLATRVVYSANGQSSPVQQVAVSTWYAAGIGVVRQSSVAPALSGGDVERGDEVIVSWDGGSSGLGAMAPVPAVLPDASAAFPGQTLNIGDDLRTFAFNDHALLLTRPPGNGGTGIVATRVDLRGRPIGAVHLSSLTPAFDARYARHAGGVVIVEAPGGDTTPSVVLTQLDTGGAVVGGLRSATVSLAGSRSFAFRTSMPAVAMDGGDTLWLVWARDYRELPAPPASEIVARPFALNGAPLAPEVVLDTTGGSNLSLDCAGGSCTVSWISFDGNDVKYSPLQRNGSSVAASPRRLTGGLPSTNSFVTALRLGSGSALIWPAALGTGASLGGPGGVALNAGFDVLRLQPDLNGERLSGVPMDSSTQPGVAARGSRLVVGGRRLARLYADDSSEQALTVVGWLDSDGGVPLATQPVHAVRYAATQPAQRQAVFADRVLLFGVAPNSASQMTTTVVWLNRGAD